MRGYLVTKNIKRLSGELLYAGDRISEDYMTKDEVLLHKDSLSLVEFVTLGDH